MNALDELLTEVTEKEKKIPSLSIVVRRGHKTLFNKTYGFSDSEGKKRLKEDDLFYLFSMTKPVTAVVMTRLMQKGLIKLDDKASDYLPEYKDAFVVKDGKEIRVGEKITIKSLLTMTAGLSYDVNATPVRETIEKSNGKATTREIVASFIKSPLLFAPCERFNYGLCMDVCSAVAEVVTGKRFDRIVKSEITDPLGMTDTCFKADKDVKKRLVCQYFDGDDGLKPVPNENELDLSENYYGGGAGLISNARDYSLFADALACKGLAGNGYELLSEEYVNLIKTPFVGGMNYNGTFTCAQGDDYSYGLGVRVRVKKSPFTPVGEFGWDGKAGSYCFMDTESGLSAVLCMSVNNWPLRLKSFHGAVREEIFKEYAGK